MEGDSSSQLENGRMDDKDIEESCEPSMLPGIRDDSGVSILVEFNEVASGSLSQRISTLQNSLTISLANIQTDVDTRESMRRQELDEVCKMRLKLLGKYVESSQEKFEELMRGWSLAKENVSSPVELQEAMNSQQQAVLGLLAEKKKIINELRWDLMVAGDHFVKDLRKQAKERDLMMERMEDQIKTLIKTYRKELAETESVNHQENEALLIRDKCHWEQYQKEVYDTELEMVTQRREKVEDYEAKIQSLILENMKMQAIDKIEQDAKLQVMVREHQKICAVYTMTYLKKVKEKHDLEALKNTRIPGLQAETDQKNPVPKNINQTKRKIQHLSKNYKYNVHQYEHLQGKSKNIAVADAKTFEEMVETVEEEVKQLVERALETDSLISKRYHGVLGEKPPLAFTELCDETLTKIKELLMDEVGILAEEGKEEDEKWNSLLSTFGISENDLPKLANYVVKYSQQETQQTEDCEEPGEYSDQAAAPGTSSTFHVTADLIHPNHVLPALKSFIKQDSRFREILRQQARDKAYWESLGNIIPEEKVKLWEEVERTLMQYLIVLKDIAELVPEMDSLRQQNTEMRRMLQKSPKPQVST
ncbi:hypothetical protein JOB18_026764 [Solea senegalensis]|uniref:Dynein regulatory complex protein 1 n=1 Tax=Solea senegalensis TaxID=28829 RepID=A0AAV6SKE6_SOLSE|nr:dynein regulatory complex protein 1-like [Solea senegalensis]KAG7518156.1 hypothetical protein JOB18_026764 [Solea senegalensis]